MFNGAVKFIKLTKHNGDGQVLVNLNDIIFVKKANAKMIERIYLLKVNKLQDSIIVMKDNYINEQQSIIVDFQNRVAECNKLNATIKNDLAKQKRKNKIVLGGAAGVVIGVIIGIICK